MEAALLIPSRFIKGETFGEREITLTIADVSLEELEKDDGSKELKGVVYFAEKSKRPPHQPLQWLLNVTTAKSLIAMFGNETDAWKGKRVTLYAPMVKAFGKTAPAIRVLGSPDISRDVRFTMKLRKSGPQEIVLKATGKA